MMRKEKKSERRVSFAEVAKNIDQSLELADPQRLEGLTRLQRVRAVKATTLQREEARLTQKYGANDPRVLTIKSKREANVELQRDLEWGVSRAQTPTPQADPSAWTLHGHVRNKALSGLPNLTVALYDENNQWMEDLGHACTDAKGYFNLTVKRGATKVNIQEAADAKDVQAAKEAEAVKDAQAAAAKATLTNRLNTDYQEVRATTNTRRGAYIHVTNNQDATLYVAAEALLPKLGEVVYREIIIDGDGCECAPPGKPRKGGDKEPTTGRYLGNKNNHELHDMSNVKPNCQVDEIKPSQRQFFTSQKEAVAAGYDFCANCFGKEKSKR